MSLNNHGLLSGSCLRQVLTEALSFLGILCQQPNAEAYIPTGRQNKYTGHITKLTNSSLEFIKLGSASISSFTTRRESATTASCIGLVPLTVTQLQFLSQSLLCSLTRHPARLLLA